MRSEDHFQQALEYSELALTATGPAEVALLRLAVESYRKSIALGGLGAAPYFNCALALKVLADCCEAEEALGLLLESEAMFETVTQMNAGDDEAFDNWGVSLSARGVLTLSPELFDQAIEKYQMALRINPMSHAAYFNWGVTLIERTEISGEEDPVRWLLEAEQLYAKAIELKPDYAKAINNWGCSLEERAKYVEPAEALELLKLAEQKYEAVLLIREEADAYFNWGNALTLQGGILGSIEFYEQAVLRYQRAVELNPYKSEAMANWGIALIVMAKLSPLKSELFLRQAFEKLLQAEELSPGSSTYNLACVCALLGEGEQCLRWLQVAKELDSDGLLELLEEDPDFDGVRDEAWFQEFLAADFE